MQQQVPLRCKLGRPPCSALHYNAYSNRTVDAPCALPRGLEREGQDVGDVKRPKAPMPVNVQTSDLAFLKSQTLDGYICANGISFLRHKGDHARLTGANMANAIECELKLHSELRTDKKQPIGPHGSQPPRGCSITLLLPRASGGRVSANAQDIIYLNALTRIAESPANGIKSLEADHSPDSAANKVRLGVVCGRNDVASFLSGSRVNPSDQSWNQSAALCISYIANSDISIAYVPLSDSRSDTIASAIETIQERCKEVQLQSGRSMVLPPPFLSANDILDKSDWKESSGEVLPFLEYQAALQSRFKKLFIMPPDCKVESLGVHAVSCGAGRPLRIGSRFKEYKGDLDPDHTIGYMFANDNDLMESYLSRCRSVVASPFNKESVTFELLPLTPDEKSAQMVIFWFKVRFMSIGSQLSLFATRVPSVVGKPLTNIENSFIQQVVPILCTVDELLEECWAIPCTDESIVPAYSPNQQMLTDAFSKWSVESYNALSAQLKSNTASTSSTKPEKEPENDVEDEIAPDYALVMGCPPGHPCTTIGDAYEALERDIQSHKLATYSFHALLTSGVASLGRNTPLESLFSRCSIEEVDVERPRSASPRKRKTPTPCVKLVNEHESRQQQLLLKFSSPSRRGAFATMLGCSTTTEQTQMPNPTMPACLRLLWHTLEHDTKASKEPQVKEMIKNTIAQTFELDTGEVEMGASHADLVSFIKAAVVALKYKPTKCVSFVVRMEKEAFSLTFKCQNGEWMPKRIDIADLVEESETQSSKQCVVWIDFHPTLSYCIST